MAHQRPRQRKRGFGFIVRFKFDAKEKEVVYFYDDVLFQGYWTIDRGDRSLHRQWQPDVPYVNELEAHYKISGDEMKACSFSPVTSGSIDATLFITARIEDSSAFLIRSKKPMVMDLGGVISERNTPLDEAVRGFLNDPVRMELKLNDTLWFESIAFQKTAIVGSSPLAFSVTAFIVKYIDGKALKQSADLEKRISLSKTPFIDAISFLHQNNPKLASPAVPASDSFFLACWLHFAVISGHITRFESNDIERRISIDRGNGAAERALDEKYIMMVLRKVLTEERANVEFVAKRKFERADLLPSAR
jgi:hypothetical protein